MLKNKLFRNGALIAAAGIAAFGVTALFTDTAEAKCYLIYCPATPAPPPPPQVHTQVVEERVTFYENRTHHVKKAKKTKVVRPAPKKVVAKGCGACYNAGYKAGLRAAKVAKPVAYKAPAHKTSYANNGRVVTRTVTRVVRTYDNAPNNYYANNTYRQSGNGVVNYAAAYNAPAYSQSVPVAAYAGRGEQWVATRTQVIRYGAPAQISYAASGQACGYGAPISNPYGQKAWVCKCSEGWMPPR